MVVWKEDTRQYATGENGYLGKFKIFSYHWNSSRAKESDEKDWVLQCFLPGIKSNLGIYAEEELKIKAKKVLEYWLSGTGLINKEK